MSIQSYAQPCTDMVHVQPTNELNYIDQETPPQFIFNYSDPIERPLTISIPPPDFTNQMTEITPMFFWGNTTPGLALPIIPLSIFQPNYRFRVTILINNLYPSNDMHSRMIQRHSSIDNFESYESIYPKDF